MEIKTITMKQLQSLHAAGKIILKNVDQNLIDHTFEQKEPGSMKTLQHSVINKQYQKEADLTTTSQECQEYKFIWTKQATFALFSAYEAKDIETDKTKKNKRFWQSIADELNELSLCEVLLTGDQVRWKFSALKKSYNKKKDHNHTSGNAPKSFDDFEERLMEILGDKSGDVYKENSFNSPILEHSLFAQPQTSNTTINFENKLENIDTEKTLGCSQENAKVTKTRKKSVHGTGSKIARTKLELEKQWLEHLQIIQNRYEDRKNHDENEYKRKMEELELKRENVHLKKKKIMLEELVLNKKIERHREKLAVEKEKCDILRSFIQDRSSIFNSHIH